MTGTWGAPSHCDAVDPGGERCALPAGHAGNHLTLAQQAAAAAVAPNAAPLIAAAPGKRVWSTRRKAVVGGVAALVVLAAIGSASGGDKPPTPSDAPAAFVGATPTTRISQQSTPTPTATPEPTVAPITYAKLTSRSWALVVKSPDKYLGRGYYIWGCISQFDAATGDDTFRAEAWYQKTAYWYLDGDNALFTGDADRLSNFVQDDVVYMKVVSLGSFSYDTQIGGNTTVPLFQIISISRKGSC